ncbi:SdrD B-like domain-containing protein [Flagellimonas sp. 2504JD1-5]
MKRILFLMLSLVMMISCSKDDEGSIIGTASADGGNVVSGITVKLYNDKAALLNSTTTDGEGNFSFTGLEAGNYYVGATITVGDVVWDSGNTPQLVYVSDEIVKEIALTLNQK